VYLLALFISVFQLLSVAQLLFSSSDLELWPITLTFYFDSLKVEPACQWSFSSKVIVWMHRYWSSCFALQQKCSAMWLFRYSHIGIGACEWTKVWFGRYISFFLTAAVKCCLKLFFIQLLVCIKFWMFSYKLYPCVLLIFFSEILLVDAMIKIAFQFWFMRYILCKHIISVFCFFCSMIFSLK